MVAFAKNNAVISPTQSPQPETSQWSSAVGHASTTGKSGRVIERLQSDIDRLHREAQLLKMRHDEVEKNNETLNTRNQYLQDRNSNYDQSHEANLRQLARKDRQLEDLREEVKREKERTSRAEDQARAASISEQEWREQASKAKAVASQRESEYDAIVSCRNMDNDRHQHGLDKVRSSFEQLLRQREEDVGKQKKLEIIAEQQKQTIGQLEELTNKLNANFKAYRTEIDSAITGLRDNASGNDEAMKQKLAEMQETTERMRWIMKVDEVINHNPPRPPPPAIAPPALPQLQQAESEPKSPKSPSRAMLPSLGRNKLHRRGKSTVSEK